MEDTIFCNDRSQSNSSTNGWNPNGGSTDRVDGLKFKAYSDANDLSCTNVMDQFSVSNNKAKLTYKVGLMSKPEMNILNNNNARRSERDYWLASPGYIDLSGSFSSSVYSLGSMYSGYLARSFGVRPAVSLVAGTEYSSGDGSMANPYVVKIN